MSDFTAQKGGLTVGLISGTKPPIWPVVSELVRTGGSTQTNFGRILFLCSFFLGGGGSWPIKRLAPLLWDILDSYLICNLESMTNYLSFIATMLLNLLRIIRAV